MYFVHAGCMRSSSSLSEILDKMREHSSVKMAYDKGAAAELPAHARFAVLRGHQAGI